jgi:hypothetical protein
MHCRKCPSYAMPGDTDPKWCKRHAADGAVDVASKYRCKVSGCDVQVKVSEDYCANHDTARKRRTRVREHQVANFLRDHGFRWTAWNKQLAETACGRYRPDFAFELTTHVVVVEVDEHQHAQLGYNCDTARMVDIYGAYGGLPVKFIRFNPDEFQLAGVATRLTMPTRLKTLHAELRAALAAPPTHALEIARLFYDSSDSRTVVASWLDPGRADCAETPM